MLPRLLQPPLSMQQLLLSLIVQLIWSSRGNSRMTALTIPLGSLLRRQHLMVQLQLPLATAY